MADHLDIAELLKIELPGKKVAMGRYDEILWKIRAGYLAVLAGALGFFVTDKSSLALTSDILIVIFWFSLVAWIIDINFRRRQLRVVKAYNELVSSAIKNLPDGEGPGHIEATLLHISGERLGETEIEQDIRLSQCLMPSVFVYLGSPLVSILLYYLQ